MDGPSGWTPLHTAAAGLVVLLLVGVYTFGQAACPDEDPPFKVRGVYDPAIAADCVARGDTIVILVDFAVLEEGGAGQHEFACAAAGSLQSLTVRAR